MTRYKMQYDIIKYNIVYVTTASQNQYMLYRSSNKAHNVALSKSIIYM